MVEDAKHDLCVNLSGSAWNAGSTSRHAVEGRKTTSVERCTVETVRSGMLSKIIYATSVVQQRKSQEIS